MDGEIFNRAVNGISPFNGDNLHLDNINRFIPLTELVEIIRELLTMLEGEKLLKKIYRCKDWFQHDCCLMEKQLIDLEQVWKLVENEESLYNNSEEDDLVNIGLYDGNGGWYLRIYVVEHFELENENHRLGSFDFSGNDKVIEKLKDYIEVNLEFKVLVTPAKKYFKNIKAKVTKEEREQMEKFIIKDIKAREGL